MSESSSEPPFGDQLMREAAGWFARMRGPDAEASRSEFEGWLARGALHRRAYNRASEIFAMGKLLSEDEADKQSSSLKHRDRSRRLVPAAGIILLIAFAAGWMAFNPDHGRSTGPKGAAVVSTQLATGPTEVRTMRLTDGSIVRLEASTSLTALVDDRARRLTLRSGAALFEVAHEARPFIVYAGGGSVTARGTLFKVALEEGGDVKVRLYRGAVDVMVPRQSANARSGRRRLNPGEALRYRAIRPADVGRPSLSASLASPQEFNSVPIADLVAAANRRSSLPIKLADPAIGEWRLSGRFRIDDTKLLAQRIAALFDLAIDRDSSGEIELRRK